MKLIITGVPGTGKTTLAGMLGKKMKARAINELRLAKKEGIAEKKGNREFEIDLNKLKGILLKELKKHESLIIEGHLLCELKLPVDLVIVLRCRPKTLEERLRKSRAYPEEKIMDNVYCEETGYCLEQAKKNYALKKIVEVSKDSNLKNSLDNIVKILRERGIE